MKVDGFVKLGVDADFFVVDGLEFAFEVSDFEAEFLGDELFLGEDVGFAFLEGFFEFEDFLVVGVVVRAEFFEFGFGGFERVFGFEGGADSLEVGKAGF